MIGIIEFREDEHSKNVRLLHNIKHDICELLKNMSETEMGEKRYPIFDERRNRGGMRRDNYGNMRDHQSYMRDDYPNDASMDNRYNY